MKKIKIPVHCCADCLMKEIYRSKPGCVLKDLHFTPEDLEKLNDCPNWQN